MGRDQDASHPWSIPRRLFNTLIGAFTLHACGGGGGSGGPAKRTLALYGDSIPHGDYQLPDGTLARLAIPPSVRLAEYLPGWTIIDNSWGGMTPREALGYGTLWPAPPDRVLPIKPFAQHIASAPEDVCLMQFGVMDAAQTGDPLFATYLDEMVGIALAAGKGVMLVGMDGRARPEWPLYDAIIRRCAEVRREPYIDISVAPVVVVDGLHVDQATADARTRVIAQAVLAA